jgi:nucleotide-binding universal stress UspA family protein
MSAEDPRGPAVLCWDASDAAERAFAHAGGILGKDHPAVVIFVHVPTESARGVFGGFSGPDAPIMGVADAENLLERGVQAATAAGFAASGLRVAAQGKTSQAIITTADEQDAPLIVMGQKQRSGLGTLLLGSVARDVLDAVHRPVLLVGPTGPEA